MIIIIKSKEINIKFYIPMFVITSSIRIFKYIIKYVNLDNKKLREIKKYVDYLDINTIILVLKELKKFKGLTLVEVKSEIDETYILIKI